MPVQNVVCQGCGLAYHVVWEGASTPIFASPGQLRSDDWPSTYSKFVRRGRVNPHKPVPSIRATESDSHIERFRGTETQQFKVTRAFDNDKGTSEVTDGVRVHHNLVRTHQALGTTPGEAAGITIGDGFRWRKVIDLASQAASENPAGGADP